MSCLYVTEQGSKISIGEGKFVVECKDGTVRYIPKETLESIMIFGNVQMTLACQKECLERNIKVGFLSTKGKYFGNLESTATSLNGIRLKKQVYLSDNEQKCLEFSKKIIKAKINNQIIVLKRYSKNDKSVVANEVFEMSNCKNKIDIQTSLTGVMGYEGIAAKNYFQGLSKVIDSDFKFNGRNRRPPKDAFNSMLSLAYTIVFYEIYAELNNRSMSPYIGLMHKLKENHPALVSDLLEEWRAVLVDSTVMSLINGHEISIDEFTKDENSGAVIISNRGIGILVKKLERKMMTTTNYLDYLDSPVSFRRAIWWQVRTLAKCVDNEELGEYSPLMIR